MTSFKSAQLIADSHDADKVVFLMDRIELGTQSLKEYQSFADDEGDVQGTENTDVLKAKLRPGDPATLIVTSIQKMSKVKAGEGKTTAAEVKRLGEQRVVFIIDECHRSTFGDMLGDIRRSFPNALFFGFTGTPIFDENQKKGSTTSMLFGDCLHRYSIADGIRDKNVLGFDPYMVTTYKDSEVRLAVALEKARASDAAEALADPQKAEVFNHWMDKSKVPMGPRQDNVGNPIHGIEDYVPTSQYGIGEPHVDMVVSDVIEQFPVLSRAQKFHGILATSSIPEAINYYRLFKQRAPELKVTALFDPSIDNDGGAALKEDALVEIIGDYNAAYGKAFAIPTWPAMKKDISSRLAHKRPYVNVDAERDQRIDLLIVVDQMLTGFDSKWVNTLYLDKVIDYENIIQAFSRTNRLFGPEKPFGVIRYYRRPHTMRGYIEAAVKLYSGDCPLDLFVNRLPANIEQMNARFREIEAVFASSGEPEFMHLPDSVEACRKFAKDFIELNGYLDSAKVQGFVWGLDAYEFVDEDGKKLTARLVFDERTYLILVQRYKELFCAPASETESGGPVAPYDLDGHITEIDTGCIDNDYMNANFNKWLKALRTGDESLELAAQELHRTFATLSRDEQRLAEQFLHDVERGDVEPEEGTSFRVYITLYARKKKRDEVDKLVDSLGIDRGQLESLMGQDLTAENLNQFGRFNALRDTMDKAKAKDFFERRAGRAVPAPMVNIQATKLLREFVLKGGFDIEAMAGEE